MQRVLLHCCCAPCAAPALEYFSQSDFAVDCLYFNPNIKPESEYFLRGEQLRILCDHYNTRLVIADYNPTNFNKAILGLEEQREGGERCQICFNLRLNETAIKASLGGYDYFCTTLTTSPHKNSRLINGIGEAISKQYSIRYLPSDFKKRNGNLFSKQLCARLGLYRQSYCGCTPN